MTQDIKAAIAGAIEALEATKRCIPMDSAKANDLEEHIAALRRIEFVEPETIKIPMGGMQPSSNHVRQANAMFNEAVNIITTGHAIVKMGDI